MEPALDFGVSNNMDWNRLRSLSFIACTVFSAASLVLRLGSRGDRIMVAAVYLALMLLPVERAAHQLTGFMARIVPSRYVLLTAIALVSAWANARFRTGGGPFHIVNAETWRGYPFMFEEWYWSQGGLSEISWHREFHVPGLLADVALPVVVFVVILRWLRRSDVSADGIRALPFVGVTAAFTWLNVEPWIGGLPLTVAGPPPPFRPPAYFSSGITLGFPLVFWNGFTSEPQFRWIAANVAIGLFAWTVFYMGFRKRFKRRSP